MYTISVTTNFSAAHKLNGYQGNCERIHGHNWTVKAELVSDDWRPVKLHKGIFFENEVEFS